MALPGRPGRAHIVVIRSVCSSVSFLRLCGLAARCNDSTIRSKFSSKPYLDQIGQVQGLGQQRLIRIGSRRHLSPTEPVYTKILQGFPFTHDRS